MGLYQARRVLACGSFRTFRALRRLISKLKRSNPEVGTKFIFSRLAQEVETFSGQRVRKIQSAWYALCIRLRQSRLFQQATNQSMSTVLRLATIALLLSAPLCLAAGTVTGRWVGAIQIPGREFPLIVDLDQPGGKNWAGSIIIQGPANSKAPWAAVASCAGAISAARTVISMPSNKSISLNPNGRLAASNQDNAIACRESDHNSVDLTSTY